MKCYEVLRCLFMHIINCISETYDGNMKCWGVHSYFHFCTYAQKKSSLFTRAFYLTDYLQIISVKSLRNSSHLFTGLHHKIRLQILQNVISMFQCFSNSSNICITYSRMSFSRSVKCCEDLWRVEASLHIANSLSYSNLWCACEEWRLFCDFLYLCSHPLWNKQGIKCDFHITTLCFAPHIIVIYAPHPYGFQPANLWLAPYIHIAFCPLIH